MAEIHILPARLPAADHITRSTEDLIAAREQGLDLGSRVAHIQANGETLLAMRRGLEHACGALRLALDQLGIQDQGREEVLHRLLDQVQQLANHARCFPRAHLPVTHGRHSL